MKRVRVVISGLVQGVWFRGWTREEARRRGLDGWVMNRRDGAVEAVFRGEDAEVDDMLEACWKGPPHAEVAEVAVVEWHPRDDPVEPGFHVRSRLWG
jgi:acylphosphatase